MDNQLAVYRHPTLTVLIDDSQNFLDSLAFHLNPQLARKTFQNPLLAIDWLNHAHMKFPKNADEPIIVGYDEQNDRLDLRNASIDLDLIFRKVTNRKRFEMPSVLVIDYAMPQMNGVEFCEAVRNLPCKKILLTGQADERIAIDTFNRKLIDCFIRKGDSDAMSHLESEIIRLQKDFFNQETNTLKDLLSRHSFAFLTDPSMAALIEQLCSRYRFIEYYLFPHPAGIMFMETNGKTTLMVIETDVSLSTQLEVADDQCAPPELLVALQEFRLVPFFCDTQGMYQRKIGHDWLQYCLPAQICQGRQNYYWALFDLPRHYLQDPVYTYAEFLLDQATSLP